MPMFSMLMSLSSSMKLLEMSFRMSRLVSGSAESLTALSSTFSAWRFPLDSSDFSSALMIPSALGEFSFRMKYFWLRKSLLKLANVSA